MFHFGHFDIPGINFGQRCGPTIYLLLEHVKDVDGQKQTLAKIIPNSKEVFSFEIV